MAASRSWEMLTFLCFLESKMLVMPLYQTKYKKSTLSPGEYKHAESSCSGFSQWSYCHLQKYTVPGQNQPVRTRRNVLAMSITLMYTLLTPYPAQHIPSL
ncbi:hypothetical protein AMECASPLE_009898 [Ameca splendens]|uniref:Secreted protein n=1 Tax=Ameca splendens TaxID=208324 RepID=A0ABV0YMU7_9TELE